MGTQLGKHRVASRRVVAPRRACGRVFFSLALTLGVGAGGCDPQPGDSCSGDRAFCHDDRTKLACEEGKLESFPCRGPFGCTVEGDLLRCDISGNAAGDACPQADEGQAACAPDGTHALRCSEGRLVVEPCHGPRGCQTQQDRAVCDHSIAAADQLCSPAAEGRSACSLEGTHVLICEEGTFAEQYPCRGPNGCRLRDGRLLCDRSIAVEGEDCSRLPKDGKACSADGKSLLSCDRGRFVAHRPCPKGCRATKEGKLYCPRK